MLTRDEKMLVADALNGCYLGLNDPSQVEIMCGSEGALKDARFEGVDAQERIQMTGVVCSGLELEVYDAIGLDGLDEKWSVDGPALLNKIAQMTPAQREVLLRGIAATRQRNDENFERDLVALEV